jgi:DNA-directed RNA polymerase subunit RPC12/RpoP
MNMIVTCPDCGEEEKATSKWTAYACPGCSRVIRREDEDVRYRLEGTLHIKEIDGGFEKIIAQEAEIASWRHTSEGYAEEARRYRMTLELIWELATDWWRPWRALREIRKLCKEDLDG